MISGAPTGAAEEAVVEVVATNVAGRSVAQLRIAVDEGAEPNTVVIRNAGLADANGVYRYIGEQNMGRAYRHVSRSYEIKNYANSGYGTHVGGSALWWCLTAGDGYMNENLIYVAPGPDSRSGGSPPAMGWEVADPAKARRTLRYQDRAAPAPTAVVGPTA